MPVCRHFVSHLFAARALWSGSRPGCWCLLGDNLSRRDVTSRLRHRATVCDCHGTAPSTTSGGPSSCRCPPCSGVQDRDEVIREPDHLGGVAAPPGIRMVAHRAPDISNFGGLFHLYYAVSSFGSNKSCIGQETRTALDSGTWAEKGNVVCSTWERDDDWNAIDPNVVVDDAGTALAGLRQLLGRHQDDQAEYRRAARGHDVLQPRQRTERAAPSKAPGSSSAAATTTCSCRLAPAAARRTTTPFAWAGPRRSRGPTSTRTGCADERRRHAAGPGQRQLERSGAQRRHRVRRQDVQHLSRARRAARDGPVATLRIVLAGGFKQPDLAAAQAPCAIIGRPARVRGVVPAAARLPRRAGAGRRGRRRCAR